MAKWYVRAFLFVAAVIFAITIGYSRILLGAHSWNQTLFGWQLGLWIALTVHFCFRERIFACQRDLQNGTRSDWVSLSLKCLLLMVFALGIQIVNYIATEPRIVNDPIWTVNIVNKCPKAKMSQAFAAKSLIESGIIGVGFGAFLGMLI